MPRDTDSPAGADLSGTGADPLTPEQRAWVNALRSGEYQQGLNFLTNGDRHCCLGVACQLAIKAGVPIVAKTNTDGWMLYDGEDTHLPPVVVRWLGMRTTGGYYGESGEALTDDNDSGLPFTQIANIIEEHAAELFEGRSS